MGLPESLALVEGRLGGNYQLASAERISPAWTKERAEYFINDLARRLPILGNV